MYSMYVFDVTYYSNVSKLRMLSILQIPCKTRIRSHYCNLNLVVDLLI